MQLHSASRLIIWASSFFLDWFLELNFAAINHSEVIKQAVSLQLEGDLLKICSYMLSLPSYCNGSRQHDTETAIFIFIAIR